MRIWLLVFVSAILVSSGTSASARIEVSYDDPDRFMDAGDRNSDPRHVVQDLESHFQTLGKRHITGDRTLSIRILDLDRAGRPWHNLPTGLRVMNGRNDRPCVDLEWSLRTASGESSGRRERICDMDYLRRLSGRYSENDPLVYEKRMLDEWFAARFGMAKPVSMQPEK